MLRGETVALRLVREADLPRLHELHREVAARGPHYPHHLTSERELRRRFEENGLWEDDHGTLVVVDLQDRLLGQLSFFQPSWSNTALELTYLLFEPETRGRGIVTEAVGLLVDYLFELRPLHRLQLMIHPDNAGSRRVADKCGFTHEGTVRGWWFHTGRHHDVELYGLLRDEWEAAR